MFTKLFVRNLSFQATEENVRELFQHAGTLGSVPPRNGARGGGGWRGR